MRESGKAVSIFLATFLLTLVLLVPDVHAATLYFSDAGGPKNWDASTPNWSTNWNGPYTTTWVNGYDAWFVGTAGTVNVAAVSANSIRFAVDGYTLSGGTITLNSNGQITTSGGTDMIGSVLAGSAGLTINSPGTLMLTGANTYSGTTTVNAGTLLVKADENLGTGNTLILGNGTFQIGEANLSGNLVSGKNVVLNGNATIYVCYGSGATLWGTISGSGNLNVNGSYLNQLILSGANSFTGQTTVYSALTLNNVNALAGSTLALSGTNAAFSFGSLTTANLGGLQSSHDLGLANASGQSVALVVGGNNESTTFSGRFVSAFSVSGSLTKVGSGTLTLSGNNSDYHQLGELTVSSGTLRFGNVAALGDGRLVVNAGGTVDLNGISPNALLSLSGAAGALITDNSIPKSSPIPTVLTVNTVSVDSTYAGSIVKGVNNQDIALVKTGMGKLTLSGTCTFTGGTTINQGTLNVAGALGGGGPVMVTAGAKLAGSGAVTGSITGLAGSTIAASGDLTLGDSNSYSGFNDAGTLAVGSNTVTLNSKGFANLGALTTLSGGTLAAPNGISLGVGCNLSAAGTVIAKVAAAVGSTIEATGNLTLGDNNSYTGFVCDGEFYTHSYRVTINSKNTAGNYNAVALGALTQVEGGTLVSPNGFLLSNGRNLVSNSGGIVSKGTGPSTSRFLNRGYVQGPAASSGDWLYFNLLFKGSTGLSADNVGFLGGYSPGDSPAISAHAGNAQLGGSSQFDIGGTTAGTGDGYYSQWNVSGDLTLAGGATLVPTEWNGFLPSVGDHFTVLTWTGALSGSLAVSPDAWFAAHNVQFVQQWSAHSLVLTPALSGDANLDGTVNGADLNIVLSNYNRTSMTWGTGDFNSDHAVNGADLNIVLSNYNQSLGVGAAVPEPSTLVILGIGAIGLLGYAWRRRRI